MCTSCYIHVDIEGLYHLLHTILFTLKFVFRLQNKYICIVHFSKISVLGNRNIKSYIINFFLHLWINVKNTCIILKKINSSYAKNIERQRTLIFCLHTEKEKYCKMAEILYHIAKSNKVDIKFPCICYIKKNITQGIFIYELYTLS